MAADNRKKDKYRRDENAQEENKIEESNEELLRTLVELNHSVSNLGKLLHQLQKNIANDAVRQIDGIATKTLH